MAAYTTIKKVKLKDPETLGESAAILYPLTGINAITAGTSGDAATTYITSAVVVSSGGVSTTLYKIKPEHLGIIDSGGKVDNSYLSFITDGSSAVMTRSPVWKLPLLGVALHFTFWIL